MKYDFRKIDFEADKQSVVKLLDDNLNENYSIDKLKWNYLDNPLKNAMGTALVYSETNEIVGLINQIYRKFFIKDNQLVIGLIGDFVVREGHRSLMPALMLLKNAIKNSLDECSIMYGYPNNKAVSVALRAGLEHLGVINRYANVVSYGPYLNKAFGDSIVIRMLGKLISYSKYSFYKLKNFNNELGYYIEHDFPDANKLDNLVKNSVFSKYITSVRSLEYLKWRYLSDKLHTYQIISCYRKHSSDLSSYAVYENEDGLLLIRDIYAVDSRAFKSILYFIYKIARSKNASAISIGFLGNKDIQNWILDSGYIKRESERTVIYKSNLSPHNEYISNYENWFLLDGDEDQ